VADARATLEKLIEDAQAKGWIPQYGLIPDYPHNALTEDHADLLRQSGITPDVAAARGYASVENGEFFQKSVHVPSWIKLAPCLLIPVWDVDGNASQCQIRPNTPRQVRGKAIKYESLPSVGLKLDIPPGATFKLADPAIPLIITEGARKADAAISKGAVCISLLGVWGFRGKNAKGGKTVLADWDKIALNGREIRIVFDSDVSTKSTVALALQRLQIFLESRGAKVEVVFLPQDEDGPKVGLDDFLKDNTILDLDRFIHKVEKQVSDTTYTIGNGRFILQKGENVEPLCNFVAKIELEEIRDDGLIQEAYYHIGGSTSDSIQLPILTVPVEDFHQGYWIEEGWRTRVQVSAGKTMRDHLLAAIKAHSLNAPQKYTYTHTGWRVINDHWYYLTANGAIPNQEGSSVEVLLAGPLTSVKLESPTVEAPKDDGILQDIIDLGPLDVVLPLFSGVWCALLGEFVTLDFSIHLEGPTGSYKSELAGLFQGFFGKEFNARHLPANWSSTANALEHQAHAAKDMLYVIDDYAPQPGKYAADQLAQKAEAIFRGAGNKAGRARLSSDIKLRPDYYARGLILSTGEEAISGQSLNARLVNLYLQPGTIRSDVLTRLQRYRDRGFFTQISHRFLSWMAENLPLDTTTPFERYRDSILEGPALHKRNASSIAKLQVAWEIFCQFIKREDLIELGFAALKSLIKAQSLVQKEESVNERAIEKLRAALRSGDCYVEVQDSGDDEKRDRYGYKLIDGVLKGLGHRIGHVDGRGVVFLDPVKVHETIWRNLGNKKSVCAALEAEGWLQMKDGRQYTTPIRHRGIVSRLYQLQKPLFDGLPKQEDLDIPENLNIESLTGEQ
jgi:hypothetical protein